MSGRLDVVKSLLDSFYNLTKLGTHVLRANTHKTVEQILEIMILKFLAILYILHLDLVCSRAAGKLSGQLSGL